eukprot:PhF_6_TR30730/c0_g1_i1/m.45221
MNSNEHSNHQYPSDHRNEPYGVPQGNPTSGETKEEGDIDPSVESEDKEMFPEEGDGEGARDPPSPCSKRQITTSVVHLVTLAPHVPPEPQPLRYLHRLRGAGHAPPHHVHANLLPKLMLRALWSSVAFLTLGLIHVYALKPADPHYILWIPPFGASIAIIFWMPSTPSAQPRNVVMGHLLGAFFGISFNLLIGYSNDSFTACGAGAVAGVLTLFAQNVLALPHPPAGATAIFSSLAIVGTGHGFSFLLSPVLFG